MFCYYLRVQLCIVDINYFHCLEIMRLLKLTEDNHKNIFGRYSSQRLKVKFMRCWSILCL